MMKTRVIISFLCLFFMFSWGLASGQIVTITPDFIDFGILNAGDTAYRDVTITTMVSYANIDSLEIIGAGEFYLVSPPTLPIILNPTYPLTITIGCSSMISGTFNANLGIGTNVGINKVIPLSAGFIDVPLQPQFELPYSYDFEGVDIGVASYYYYDLGLSPTWITVQPWGDVVSVEVTGNPAFQLVSVTEPASSIGISYPYTLYDPNWLDVQVSFTPTVPDTVTAYLTVWDGNGMSSTTILSGHGNSSRPQIRIEPNSLIVQVTENDSLASSFEIFNDGGADLNYTIDTATFPWWIYLDPMGGMVAPLGSSVISVFTTPDGVAPGNYSYVMTINSNDPTNPSMNLMITVEVLPAPLTADFHAVPTSGHAPLTVYFYDDSTSSTSSAWSTITNWFWDFQNDGIIDSQQQSPTFTYTQPGNYSIRLVVQTVSGVQSEKIEVDYIQVQNQNPILVNPIGPLTINEDTIWGPNYINAVFSDPDGDNITVTSKSSEHLTASITAWMLSITPAPNWSGTETISITAVDPYGGAAQNNILVTVLPVNDAPVLSVPADLYFLCNSVFHVDFGEYIDDPDNPDAECSILLSHTTGGGPVNFAYTPVNTPNLVGQLAVDFTFTAPEQQTALDMFTISVNDNAGRLIATQNFTMHVIDHFMPQVTIDDTYTLTGQTVGFNDATLGNPNYWQWTFGDGGTSTEKNPSHQYLTAGTFDVVLRLGYTGLPNEERQITMPGLIHLTGTAVTVDFLPANWIIEGSPYNLFGNVVIDTTVVISPDVIVNLESESPILVLGSLNANGARFQPMAGSSSWGGFRFAENGNREVSHLTDCEIVDALNPIEIVNQSPVLDGLTITVADTLAQTLYGGAGIRISGNSGCTITDSEVLNYAGGIVIENDSGTRETPVLTNIRVRNSTNTQRQEDVEYTGMVINGTALLHEVEIDNFTTGLSIGSSNMRDTASPVLTNIRVRNSTNTQRTGYSTGLKIMGDAAPSIDSLSIWDVDRGLILEDVAASTRDVVTLTNVRVRNSTNTQRSITNGMIIRNTPSLEITDAEFDDFATGIMIETSATREINSPVLTNIRVRNSTNTQRTATTGVSLTGAIAAHLDNVEIEDYTYGLVYNYDASMRVDASPVLTNIRVRNSTNTQRQDSIGAQFNELGRFSITDMQVDDYTTGIKIIASPTRETTNPVLTNVRVRNSTNTQRDINTGIVLGSGVEGTLKDGRFTEATVGILVAEGNRTVISNTLIENCVTGLQAYGSDPLPFKKLTMVVHDYYRMQNPNIDFTAFRLNGSGPWDIYQNTIHNYKKGVVMQDANLNLHTNIIWTNNQDLVPIVAINSQFNASYNDIFYPGGVFPGFHNINLNPQFALSDSIDFAILRNSPCIDAGSPDLPEDADASIADQGAHPYLHRASFVVNPRFVTVGSQVTFTNTSIGHDWADTIVSWDVNNDDIVDSNSRSFIYTYESPGVYDVNLTMQSGPLYDNALFQAFVVVSTLQLPQPLNPQLVKDTNDIVMSWEPVTQTVEGFPVQVPYYLVYKADKPNGIFYFHDYVLFANSYRDIGGALSDRAFYIVIGFLGSREELLEHIARSPRQNRSFE